MFLKWKKKIYIIFQTNLTENGTVPKNLYKIDFENPTSENGHSLYNSISLSHGQVHHVAINTNDVGAVLTWDFDVMRHNVIFTVLHEKNTDNIDTEKGRYIFCVKKPIYI